MTSGQFEESLRIRQGFIVSLTDEPNRCPRTNGRLGEIQNTLYFRNGRSANEPSPAPGCAVAKKNVFHPVGDDVDPIARGRENLRHEMSFPRGQGDAGVGLPVSIPSQASEKVARNALASQPHDRLLQRAGRAGSGPQSSQQFGHHHFDPFLMGLLDVRPWRTAKVMYQIAALPRFPPPEMLDFHANLLQGGLGLFDLDLEAPMSQKKGVRMIKQNSHAVVYLF